MSYQIEPVCGWVPQLEMVSYAILVLFGGLVVFAVVKNTYSRR